MHFSASLKQYEKNALWQKEELVTKAKKEPRTCGVLLRVLPEINVRLRRGVEEWCQEEYRKSHLLLHLPAYKRGP